MMNVFMFGFWGGTSFKVFSQVTKKKTVTKKDRTKKYIEAAS